MDVLVKASEMVYQSIVIKYNKQKSSLMGGRRAKKLLRILYFDSSGDQINDIVSQKLSE